MTCKKIIVFVTAILMILHSGCGEEQSTEEFYPINIALAPSTSSGADVEIDKIVIRVEGDDMKTIEKEFELDAGKSEFSRTIDIPIGTDRKITVKVLDKEGNTIYEGTQTISGEETINVSADANAPFVIMLDPTQETIVKLFPYQKKVGSGDRFTIDVVAKNFPDLFGITFGLEFDESYVKPVEVDAIGSDKLFGNNVLFVDDIDQDNREPGTLSIGITRIDYGETEIAQGGENTVDTEGIIVSVKFEAIATGETKIELDYENLVWTEGDELSPPTEHKKELDDLRVFADRGETTVIIGELTEPDQPDEEIEQPSGEPEQEEEEEEQ